MTTKTNMGWLVGAVVTAHCVAIALLVLLPGCGKTVEDPNGTTLPADESGPMPGKGAVALPVPPHATSGIADAKKWTDDTTSYVVVSGDTLSGIARRYGVSMDVVMAMNGIKNPSKLRVGQKITLPGKVDVSKPRPEKKKTTPRAAGAPSAAPAGDGGAYVVKAGESLSRIAARNKITVQALKDANHLKSDRLLIGQKLVIPGPGQTTEPRAPVVAPVSGGIPLMPKTEAPVVPTERKETVRSSAVGSAAPATEGTHVVEEGEDLRSIAMRNMVGVSELRKVNNLSDDAEVKPGQVLKLPASE